MSRNALLSENRCLLIIIIFAWGDTFSQEAREEQIIHVNEKQSMLADETSRTRFKTRFQVSGNERCYVQPSAVFFLSPSSSFCFRALQSGHLRTTRNQALSFSLSSSLYVGASKRRVTACHIIMQFTANRCYRDEFRHSCSRDLNFSSKRRNENF